MKKKKKFQRGKWEVNLKYDGVPIIKNKACTDDEIDGIMELAKLKSK